jgi:hypothetical protein
MNEQQQYELADFLNAHLNLPRDQGIHRVSWRVTQRRPTANELAEQFLRLAEFQALRLGTWLSTPEGELLIEAVEMISPPFYRTDIELIVEALQIAAKNRQHRVRRDLALGAALVFAAMTLSSGRD